MKKFSQPNTALELRDMCRKLYQKGIIVCVVLLLLGCNIVDYNSDYTVVSDYNVVSDDFVSSGLYTEQPSPTESSPIGEPLSEVRITSLYFSSTLCTSHLLNFHPSKTPNRRMILQQLPKVFPDLTL